MSPILLLGLGWIVGCVCTVAAFAVLGAAYGDDLMAGMNECSRTEQMRRNCG